MKRSISRLTGCIMLFALFLTGPGHAQARSAVIEVKVQGMVCDFCARAIEKTIEKRDEVASLDVDLTTKLLTIRLKSGKDLSDDAIKSLVTDAGYTVNEIVR